MRPRRSAGRGRIVGAELAAQQAAEPPDFRRDLFRRLELHDLPRAAGRADRDRIRAVQQLRAADAGELAAIQFNGERDGMIPAPDDARRQWLGQHADIGRQGDGRALREAGIFGRCEDRLAPPRLLPCGEAELVFRHARPRTRRQVEEQRQRLPDGRRRGVGDRIRIGRLPLHSRRAQNLPCRHLSHQPVLDLGDEPVVVAAPAGARRRRHDIRSAASPRNHAALGRGARAIADQRLTLPASSTGKPIACCRLPSSPVRA